MEIQVKIRLTRCGETGKDGDSPGVGIQVKIGLISGGTQVELGTHQMWGSR